MRFGATVSPLLLVSLISVVLPAVSRVEPLWRILAAVWLIALSAANVRPASLNAGSRVTEATP